MTVKQMIDDLSKFPPDAPIFIQVAQRYQQVEDYVPMWAVETAGRSRLTFDEVTTGEDERCNQFLVVIV